MTRYWVSWTTGNYIDEGCTAPPFQFWLSAQSARRAHLPQTWPDGEEKDDCSLCAMIDAPNEEAIWTVIAKHFPDYEQRFISERADDAKPGDRFLDFENRTSLT